MPWEPSYCFRCAHEMLDPAKSGSTTCATWHKQPLVRRVTACTLHMAGTMLMDTTFLMCTSISADTNAIHNGNPSRTTCGCR